MKGKGFLRITGILMIIGGAASILLCGLAVVAALFLDTLGINLNILSNTPTNILVTISGILFVVGGIIELIAGIIGTRNAARPERYKACIGWGIVALAIQVISIVFSLITGNINMGLLIVSIIFGVIIPILFIIGALINRRASLNGANSIEWERERLAKKQKKLEKKEIKFNKREAKLQAKNAKKEAREAEEQARKEAAEAQERARKEAEENARRAAEQAAAQNAVQANAPAQNIDQGAQVINSAGNNYSQAVDTTLDAIDNANVQGTISDAANEAANAAGNAAMQPVQPPENISQ